MTRHTFGFNETHTIDDVAAALAGHFDPAQLAVLVRQVGKAANRRRRRRKNPASLAVLAGLLEVARDRTRGGPVPMQVFAHRSGGEPLEVVLVASGETVTEVPPGAQFAVPAGVHGTIYARPVGAFGIADSYAATAGDTVAIAEPAPATS